MTSPGPGKRAASDLAIDLGALTWQRSGGHPGSGQDGGDGSIEVAFADDPAQPGGWVLVRVAGDPDQRVLVYDRHEWICFLDGVRKGEFDDAAS
jgi:Domain of unknown function (DUF397)